MFYHDRELQSEVEIETSNPYFAKMLQQAIGGAEEEMRVALNICSRRSLSPVIEAMHNDVNRSC